MLEQVVSLGGAVAILTAYVAAALGRLRTEQLAYSLLNLVGSAALTYVALVGGQLGFTLLEGTWAAVSAYGVVRSARTAGLSWTRPPGGG